MVVPKKLLSLVSSCCLLGLATWTARGECSAQEKDGKMELRNPFCSLTFIPRGGACVSFLYGGKEFTSGRGMLEDLFWENANYALGEFVDVHYQREFLDKGPGKVSLRLWASGAGAMHLVEYSKTVTLVDDSSLVRVDYEIRNLPESMGSCLLTPWTHNILGVKGEANCYYMPTPGGVVGYAHDPDKPLGNVFVPNASRGWTAVVGKSGVGLAAIVDYRYLKQFYNCFGGSLVSVEWMLGPVAIKSGESFKTTFFLHPFSGLDRLDGVSPDAAGELDVRQQENAVLAKLSAARALKGKASLRARLLPGGDWVDCGAAAVEMKADKEVELRFPVDMSKQGTYVFSCSLRDAADKELLQMERDFVAGLPSGNYELVANEAKLIKEAKNYCEFKPKEDVVTPHIPWAKPYAGGKLKGLFVVDAVRLREVVELAQRLDLDYTTPTLHLGDKWYVGWYPANDGFSTGVKEMEPLLSKDYQFALVSGFHHSLKSWPALAADTAGKLLPKVADGMGMIYIHPKELKGKLKELYDRSVPAGEGHALFSSGFIVPGVGKGAVRVAEHGKGRIVFLDYPGSPITPDGVKWPPEFNYWDYVFSFVAKAALWASRREPPVKIASLPGEPGDAAFELENLAAANALTAQLDIRDNDAKLEASLRKDIVAPPGKSVQTFRLPPLKNGAHFLDFHLRDAKGETVNWTVQRLQNTRKAWLAAVELDSDFCREGGTLRGRVKIGGTGKEDLELVTSWVDAFGRLAGRRSETVSPQSEHAIALDIDKSYSAYNQLTVSLREKGDELDAASRDFFVHVPPERRWAGYSVLLWHHSGNDSLPTYIQQYYAARELKAIGVDSMFGYNAPPLLKAGMNIFLTGLYRQDLAGEAFKEACETMVRKPCLSDPKFLDVLRNSMEGCGKAWMKYSPTLYSIGDENSLTGYEQQCDICVSAYCLPRFQQWLLGRYGDLKRLNEEWGTSFAKLEDARPLNFQQAVGRKGMNFSPWADHRSFMDTVFSEAMRFCKEKVKSSDPYTPVGECGTSRDAAYGGWDWHKRLQVWETLMPYSRYGDQLEIQRSFCSGKMAGYTGYREGKFGLYCNWWWGLLNGEKGIALWFTPLVLNPDLTKATIGEAVADYANGELKKGVGDLIANSARLHDGVAIHYSQPSLQAAYVLKNAFGYETLKQYYDNRHEWLSTLERLGLQYKFVASQQIEGGKLLDGEYKVLILPLSRAVSDKEAEQMRRFVERGGVVIADCQAGLFDEHLKLRGKGALDPLFGLERLEAAPVRKSLVLSYGKLALGVDFCDPVVQGGASACHVIQAREKKLGEVTVNLGGNGRKFAGMAVNSVGGGKAIYLNLLPNGGAKEDGMMRDVLLGQALLKPQVQVRKGGANAPCEVVRFKCGDFELVGILQDPLSMGMNPAEATREEMLAKGYPVDVEFPREAHVYDVRKRQYLGLVRQVKGMLAPGEALVYALAPRKIEGVALGQDKTVLRQGEAVACQVSLVPRQGDGVARVEVFDPEGKLSDCYTGNLALKQGEATLSLKTALDDKPGKWRIVVRDVVSGLEADGSFELRK